MEMGPLRRHHSETKSSILLSIFLLLAGERWTFCVAAFPGFQKTLCHLTIVCPDLFHTCRERQGEQLSLSQHQKAYRILDNRTEGAGGIDAPYHR
jgi:hypothetical protein